MLVQMDTVLVSSYCPALWHSVFLNPPSPQSVPDSRSLPWWFPRLCSVRWKYSQGVRHAPGEHQWLHHGQQRRRGSLVSEHTQTQTYSLNLPKELGMSRHPRPGLCGVPPLRRHNTHASLSGSLRPCLPPRLECHQACHLSTQYGMGRCSSAV